MEERTINRKKKVLFSFLALLIPIAVMSALYLSTTIPRAGEIYYHIKKKARGWKGKVHRADPELGFSPVLNSAGAHVFPVGPDIPMRYDEHGFRVPLMDNNDSSSSDLLILSLGGSFTYGDATYAKDTYPQLVGQYLGGTVRNAAVCSYGLTHMLILARKLVPVYKPDYLLIQYSPWLVERAQSPFGDSYFGKLPIPYLYEENGGFAIFPPVFLTKITDLSLDHYRDTPINTADKVSFYLSAGLPLLLHDDMNMLFFYVRKFMGIIPEPSKAHDKLIRYVYRKIDEVIKKEGTKMVIVVLGNKEKPVEISRDMFPADAIVVNAQRALIERMPVVDRETYDRLYRHWRGSPPRIVDRHPNEAAHKIIAEAIVSRIRRSSDY